MTAITKQVPPRPIHSFKLGIKITRMTSQYRLWNNANYDQCYKRRLFHYSAGGSSWCGGVPVVNAGSGVDSTTPSKLPSWLAECGSCTICCPGFDGDIPCATIACWEKSKEHTKSNSIKCPNRYELTIRIRKLPSRYLRPAISVAFRSDIPRSKRYRLLLYELHRLPRDCSLRYNTLRSQQRWTQKILLQWWR